MTAVNSSFHYAGGKFYARKLMTEYILAHTNYVEPLRLVFKSLLLIEAN